MLSSGQLDTHQYISVNFYSKLIFIKKIIENVCIIPAISSWPPYVNSLWLNNTIWWLRSGSTLPGIMGWCLMAPNHYLKTNVDLPATVFWHSHMTAISQYLWYPSTNKVWKLQFQNYYNCYCIFQEPVNYDPLQCTFYTIPFIIIDPCFFVCPCVNSWAEWQVFAGDQYYNLVWPIFFRALKS